MRSFIIITAANAAYFELVQGTIRSIRDKPQGKDAVIGFYDLGCTPEQLQWLHTQVDLIRVPNWDVDFPGRSEAPEHLKALVERPFLPRYFPNFDTYVWIDADAWVQDWSTIELFLQGAESRGLAIVPELDRGSRLQYGGLPRYWQWSYVQYQAAFGKQVAEQLSNYPMLNVGAFALRHDAPHWNLWIQYLEKGLQHSTAFIEQLALNLAIYSELFEQTEMLPAWCNWTCHYGLPLWDRQRACFVEPYLPHTRIGILHLTQKKHTEVRLPTTERSQVTVSLRYPSPD